MHYDQRRGVFDDKKSVISVGALGDSFYEYLLKVWLWGGRQRGDAYLRTLWDAAVDGMITHLRVESPADQLVYLQKLHVPSMEVVH